MDQLNNKPKVAVIGGVVILVIIFLGEFNERAYWKEFQTLNIESVENMIFKLETGKKIPIPKDDAIEIVKLIKNSEGFAPNHPHVLISVEIICNIENNPHRFKVIDTENQGILLEAWSKNGLHLGDKQINELKKYLDKYGVKPLKD